MQPNKTSCHLQSIELGTKERRPQPSGWRRPVVEVGSGPCNTAVPLWTTGDQPEWREGGGREGEGGGDINKL